VDSGPPSGYSDPQMSRQELVSAFLDGQISRRTLIRRLIAGGVSAGAAISYAQLLSPERADASVRAGGSSDQYPLVDLAITSPSLAAVRNNGFIKVTVFCTEELQNATFRVFLKTAAGGVWMGQRTVASVLSAAGSRALSVTFPDTTILNGRSQARFYIQMTAQDAEGYGALASTGKTLS
jgi:hypothetical protein